MTRKSAEQVSMLVDDEVDEWERAAVIHALKNDRELRASWERYHLISDIMRGNLSPYADLGLADRVARAIEHEPAFLQPQTANVPSKHSPRHIHRTGTSIAFALAASLSAIAVVGVMNFDRQAPASSEPVSVAALERQAAAPVVAQAPAGLADGQAGIVLAAAQNEPAQMPQQDERGQAVAADLYDYLVNYHQYAAARTESDDMLSYIRVVSYQP